MVRSATRDKRVIHHNQITRAATVQKSNVTITQNKYQTFSNSKTTKTVLMTKKPNLSKRTVYQQRCHVNARKFTSNFYKKKYSH